MLESLELWRSALFLDSWWIDETLISYVGSLLCALGGLRRGPWEGHCVVVLAGGILLN